MEPSEPRIEIFAPFGEAFETTKKILFQPFNLAKWFVIGFAAWLGQCVYVGGLLDGSRTYGAVLCGYTVALVAVTQIDSPQTRFLTSRPIFSFGGAKQSGIGTELDQEGLEAFTQVKIINMAK